MRAAAQAAESIFGTRELGLDRRQRVVQWLFGERWTFASLGLHALMLGCMALMPPKSSALALDRLNEDVRYARYLAAPVEIEPLLATPGTAQSAADGARAHAAEGMAGSPEQPRTPKRMGRGKPAARPSDHAAEAHGAGILGVLPAFAAALGTGASAFDPAGLPDEATTALGGLAGDTIGSTFGFHGLGMRGTGRGGGGEVLGSIGVGKLGQGLGTCASCSGAPLSTLRRSARVPRVISHDADVHGALAKEAIRRTIQRHLNEVRFCYTEGLRASPELSGRAQVLFVITSSGTVQDARVVDSALGQPQVESCIAAAVRRWTFPAPEGGGYVRVRYPFVFEQIGP